MGALPSLRFGGGVRRFRGRQTDSLGVRAMVSTLAAAILVSLGLVGSAPVGHATQPSSPTVFVAGHGWGHGIGLAQYGAYGYALHGWKYDKIVAHYYPGTTLGPAPLKKVRVLLVQGKKRAVVSSISPFVVRDGSGKLHNLPAGPQTFGPGLKLKVVAQQSATALPGPLVFLPGADPLVLGSRAYRGTLRVKTVGSALQVVNIVGLEPYLWGVVPSEMPDRWPAEALEAQAVVARTYALSHLQKGDFDLYPDTRSQVYGGIAAESPSASDAVNLTAGRVVLYQGKLADTFFFSSSGGRTADVQDVWPSSEAVPYLVSVPDPYDTLSPYHDWGPLRFTAGALARKLHVPGRLVDLHADVAPSGRVRTLTLVGANGEQTLSGSVVRRVLGLRSTWFQIGMLGLTQPSAPVVYGSQASLAGLARGLDKLTLEARPYGGQWSLLASLAPKSGQVSPRVAPKVSTDYRLVSGGIRSNVVHLAVAPFVRLIASQDQFSVSGLARPLLPGAAVQIQRQGGSGWATVAKTTVTPDGTFAASVTLTPGSYRARLVAGRGFAIGVSKVLQVVAP
jgi:stage II sporulation protein D